MKKRGIAILCAAAMTIGGVSGSVNQVSADDTVEITYWNSSGSVEDRDCLLYTSPSPRD